MIALKMDDIKAFTSKLFVGATFDQFLLRTATLSTFNTFTIDGHIRQGYYSQEELREAPMGEFSTWGMIKPICFSLIKGKRLPGSFQITLQLAPDGVARLLQAGSFGVTPEQVAGLYLNVRYEADPSHLHLAEDQGGPVYGRAAGHEGAALSCVTGTSLKTFVMDKVVDGQWDEAVRKFLQKEQLFYTEVG